MEPDNVFELDPAHRRATWAELPERDVAPEDWARFRTAIGEIFEAFGMDLDTPGTRETPERFLRALYDATAGYEGDPKLLTAFPAEGVGGHVIEGPISFSALCEHHALPSCGANSCNSSVTDVALVCGGAGALGSAIVEALRARGDEVVVADRNTVDLTDAEAVEAFWERLADRPRWVVNAAGGFRPATVAQTEPEDLRFLTELNFETAWWSCRAAARRLPDDGAIVNVAARAGLTGGAGSAAYAVTK